MESIIFILNEFKIKILLKRRGQKLPPLGETIPKKHHQNLTLKDANLNIQKELRFTIYAVFLKVIIFLKMLLLLRALIFLYF